VSIDERSTSFKSCFNDELSDDNDEFDSAAALAAVHDVVLEANE
jgi:hypothetical protein